MVALVPRFRMHDGLLVSQPDTPIFVNLPAFEPIFESAIHTHDTHEFKSNNVD